MDLETDLIQIPEVTPDKESHSPGASIDQDANEEYENQAPEPDYMSFANKNFVSNPPIEQAFPNPTTVLRKEMAVSQPMGSQNVDYWRKVFKVQESTNKHKFKHSQKGNPIINVATVNPKRKVE